jgi:hypothetical protein
MFEIPEIGPMDIGDTIDALRPAVHSAVCDCDNQRHHDSLAAQVQITGLYASRFLTDAEHLEIDYDQAARVLLLVLAHFGHLKDYDPMVDTVLRVLGRTCVEAYDAGRVATA